MFRGSANNSLRLPPNIPLTSSGILENGERIGNNEHLISDYGGNHTGTFRSQNLNIYSDKGVHF